MTETRKLRVFLCHSSQDKPIVRELYQRLNAESWIDPWLDEEKLLPGQDWDMEIEKTVEAADAVIVCVSSKSVSKEGYVQRELKFVIDIALEKPEGTIFIIPVRLDNCQVPRRIKSWQYVDYFPVDRKKWAFDKLIGSLKKRWGGVVTDPPAPLPPVYSIDRSNPKIGGFVLSAYFGVLIVIVLVLFFVIFCFLWNYGDQLFKLLGY